MSSDAEPQKDATTAPVRIQLRKEIDKDTQKEHYVREIIPMPPPPPSSILPIFRYIPKSMHPILDYFPYSSPEEREFLVHTKNRALVFGSVGSLLFASASIFTLPRLIPKSPRPIRMIFHGLFFGVGALAGVAGSLSEAMNTYKTVLPEDSKFRKALESEERPHATFMGERIEIPTDGQSKKE